MALSSRQDLIDYCLRRLGFPVIEINVDEDQISDRIDDALQFWYEYHFDGRQKTFISHKITGDTVTLASVLTGNYIVGETLTGLTSGVIELNILASEYVPAGRPNILPNSSLNVSVGLDVVAGRERPGLDHADGRVVGSKNIFV